jgi:hypothetical protein
MLGRSVEMHQRFRRKRYFYLQRTSIVSNTLFRRHRLGPRTKFHTNRKQLPYHPWTHFDTSCIQTEGTRQTRLIVSKTERLVEMSPFPQNKPTNPYSVPYVTSVDTAMPDCRVRLANFVFTSKFKWTYVSSWLITHTEFKWMTPVNFSLYGNETYQVATKFSQAAVQSLFTSSLNPHGHHSGIFNRYNAQMYSSKRNVWIKRVKGLFWTKERIPLKQVAMGVLCRRPPSFSVSKCCLPMRTILTFKNRACYI